MWISEGGSSIRISSSRHASSRRMVWAPGSPSLSLANEQNKHEATQTLVTSMRMLRLKYARSWWRRVRSRWASSPTAIQSGCRKRATPASNDSRSPAANFWAMGSRVDMRPRCRRRRKVRGEGRSIGRNEDGAETCPFDVPGDLASLDQLLLIFGVEHREA